MLDAVTPTRARELLDRHGLWYRRSLGQHFLVDPNTARRIVRLAELPPDATVLEIGPGLGSVTVALAQAARRIVAVEIDRNVVEALRDALGDAPGVEVVVADALNCDLSRMLGEEAHLVANLPYNIATPLCARVLEDVPEVQSALVMVQREVGERWTARPGTKLYGAISVKIAYYAEASVVGEVSPRVFLPPPKVDSVLVRLHRHPPPVDVGDARAFCGFVARAFGHRRKTLPNALAAAGIDRDDAVRAIEEAALAPSVRPEGVGIEGFAAVYRHLEAHGGLRGR